MRYATILGILCAALAIVFHLAGIAVDVQPYLTNTGLILVGAGVLTGN